MDGKDGVCIWGKGSESSEREKHLCLFLREQGKWGVCGEGGKGWVFVWLTSRAKDGKEEYKCLCLCFPVKERSSPKKSPWLTIKKSVMKDGRIKMKNTSLLNK